MVNFLFLDPTSSYASYGSMSIDISIYGTLLRSAGLVISQACQVYFVCLVQCVVYNHATSQSSVSVCVIVKQMWSSSDRRVNVTSSSSWSFVCLSSMRHRLVSEFCYFSLVIIFERYCVIGVLAVSRFVMGILFNWVMSILLGTLGFVRVNFVLMCLFLCFCLVNLAFTGTRYYVWALE